MNAEYGHISIFPVKMSVCLNFFLHLNGTLIEGYSMRRSPKELAPSLGMLGGGEGGRLRPKDSHAPNRYS